jgi:DNA-binding SARP family transcriptional activator
VSPLIRFRVLGSLSLEGAAPNDAADLVAQPKCIALLAYLALAKPRGLHRRDRIVGLLWPELDQDHARASLRKTLYRVRQSIGEDAIVSHGAELLGLAFDSILCDAVQFDDALNEGGLREALDLYAGELLPGFFVPETGTFEDWLERERASYNERAVHCAWKLVERFAADQELTNASQLARLVARLAPTDERMLRRVLTMLARLGDRAGAIAVYGRFADRLWRDYETRPSAETQKLVDAIQRGDAL